MTGRVTDGVRIRSAEPHETKLLSELAFASKAYWGYDAEFMRRCVAELTVTRKQIESDAHAVFVCEHENEVRGFYALAFLHDGGVELDALFVAPAYIGQGYGRRLLEHAATTARDGGALMMTIQGDPNADAFYRAMGAQPTGTRASASIPGRFLPLYSLPLAAERRRENS